VKSRYAALLLVLALLLLGCGSGKVVPPPPAGPYSNASLTGQYAFLLNGNTANGAYTARIGSFTADGSGHVTGGLQDMLNLNTGAPASVISITSGSYTIQSNGTGTLTINGSDGSVLQLMMMLESNSAGFLAETDFNAASNGTFNLQTSSDFSNAALAHAYVFALSGVSFLNSTAAPIAMIGQTVLNGSGAVTGGVMDTNDGHSTAPSGATPITASTYSLDTNGNGTNFGRGTMSFNGRTYAFYIVDSTHYELLEEDSMGGSSGEVLQQLSTIPTENSAFKGGFVYFIGSGVSFLGSQGQVVRVARFTADGSGHLGAISLDDNNDGTYTHVSQGGNISAATYAIDTAYAGSGRGTYTFHASGPGTFIDTFYMISPTQGVVSENSRGIIGTGPLYSQNSPSFSVASVAGTYVSLWIGEQLSYITAVPFEENFLVHHTLANSNSSNISGVSNYVELGIASKNFYTNVGIGGTLTINKEGTVNNLYQFAVAGPNPVTVDFQAYFTDSGAVFMICNDTTRVTSGMSVPQQQ
jgi:hypothetical protein